ncbi:hypothetical protein HELRODRAFT_78594 [Helobdella robusta]|uniref:TOG domain-containing protein n=1 Tax=Helobdella robusta TaxID=6412 RepID=T1G3D6_HELRO|nr:hypothetical protein HELRODRAFT_78594 [Helobdella robusta]ESO04897.1 hypothetical protein HELRODRAFT_78594 [Helobdella robusta]
MGDDSEWLKLPTEEKCQHKAWKARVTGYEELIKLFQTLTDEKSPEFSKYLGLVKKFVTDANVVAQEKGLEATLVFVENSFHAGKTAGEVCSGIVAKCLNQKPKIKDLGIAIMMAYIEAEKQDIVQEELMKGLSNKQPKVVAACVVALREALRDFGTKIIQVKPILKQLQVLLEDRDKVVRDETKQLVVEIYKWIGAALKPQLTNLKPVQITELDAEFEKVPPSKPQQLRFLRSQQDLKAKMLERAAAGNVDGGGDGAIVAEEVDAYDLMDPVNVLAKLPKDFYEKVEEKKWQDRKEALDDIQKLVDVPKLENGDYGDLVRALKKVVSKDTNVILVAIAAKCITLIALGLRKKFSAHAVGCIETAIEKFKEKKANVVQALKETVDACFRATTLEAISEVCIAALDHKTPSVKAETISFLARCFSKCTVATLPKKLLKPFVTGLLKTANDTTLEVREASFEALGTAMKVVSEKAIMPFLTDVDPIKLTKIKEYYEKANASAKSATEATKPAAAAATTAASAKGPPKKAAKKKTTASAAGNKGKKAGNAGAALKEEVVEKELPDEVVEEKMAALFPGDTLPNLASNNWKDRLASLERMIEVMKTLAKDDLPVQAFVRTVVKKPGLKDSNFQVLKLKIDLISTAAQRGNFSKRSAEYCLSDMIDKIGDIKNGPGVQECLTSITEATSLDFVAPQVLTTAFEQKNPKNQSEALNWLCNAIKQFGLKLKVKSLIETINKALASANPAVRTSGISLIGVIYMYMGPPLRMFFEKEKPTLLQQIDAEFERVKDEKPPAPTRGLKPANDVSNDGEDGEGDDAAGDDGNEVNINDLIPRVDISDKMTDALLSELEDKNWKVRKEALEKIQAIVADAKFITPSVGALPESLKPRLVDSNKILGSMTIALCQQLAISMGPPIKQHAKSVIPGLLANFGDSKANVRQAAVKAVNTYLEQVGASGLASIVEGEILLDSLKNENPTLRTELFGWLAEKLPTNKKLPAADLKECIPILFACIEDRNADVRKKANEALMPFMMHCGYDGMLQKLSTVKPASKDTLMKALEQARSTLPARPATGQQAVAVKSASTTKAASKSAAEVVADEVDAGQVAATSTSATAGKSKIGGKSAVPGTTQKKVLTSSKKKNEQEEDNSPPMKVSNAKDQRTKDEKNLKVLKWNFDSPRREFIDQLKMQMEPHFNRTLLDQLYHADFKFHIKAMDTLIKVTETGMESTMCNLDLILKWMTLRFFDTNTTVLLKALEYLLIVFERLVAEKYHMSENEAVSFLPYLINKVGDPKDNIRRDIRLILQLVCNVYPSARVSAFLMEGLKSKNAKQRTECLEEIGLLIQKFGINMCQPSPSVGLKVIAQQIGDRDNSVRSAALNTIVNAYDIQGEIVFKYIGQLNDKDMSMLEERIKRSTRTKTSTAVVNNSSNNNNMVANPLLVSKNQNVGGGLEEGKPSRLAKPSSSGMLRKLIEKNKDKVTNKIVCTLLYEKKFCFLFTIQAYPLPQSKPISALKSIHASSEDRQLPSSSTMDCIIMQAGSADINLSISAFQQLCKFKELTSEINRDVLKDLLRNFMIALLDERVKVMKGEGSDMEKAINITVVKVIENINYTCVMSANIKLLHEAVSMKSPYLDLVMKCLWKMLRMMPSSVSELNLDIIISDIHNFLKAFPSHTWKDKSKDKDMPLRTLKTILHTIMKHVGDEILNHMTLVDSGYSGNVSEVEQYIRKVLKKGSMEATDSDIISSSNGSSQVWSHKISRSVQDSLAEIFKKIGSRETTNEGLNNLYDFKLKHPDADLEPFLKKSTEFFQNYIKERSQQQQQQRQRTDGRISTTTLSQQLQQQSSSINRPSHQQQQVLSSTMATSSSAAAATATAATNPTKLDFTPEQYMERLKDLRAKCGLDNTDFSLQNINNKYNIINNNINDNNNRNNNNNNASSSDQFLLAFDSASQSSNNSRDFGEHFSDRVSNL